MFIPALFYQHILGISSYHRHGPIGAYRPELSLTGQQEEGDVEDLAGCNGWKQIRCFRYLLVVYIYWNAMEWHHEHHSRLMAIKLRVRISSRVSTTPTDLNSGIRQDDCELSACQHPNPISNRWKSLFASLREGCCNNFEWFSIVFNGNSGRHLKKHQRQLSFGTGPKRRGVFIGLQCLATGGKGSSEQQGLPGLMMSHLEVGPGRKLVDPAFRKVWPEHTRLRLPEERSSLGAIETCFSRGTQCLQVWYCRDTSLAVI